MMARSRINCFGGMAIRRGKSATPRTPELGDRRRGLSSLKGTSSCTQSLRRASLMASTRLEFFREHG